MTAKGLTSECTLPLQMFKNEAVDSSSAVRNLLLCKKLPPTKTISLQRKNYKEITTPQHYYKWWFGTVELTKSQRHQQETTKKSTQERGHYRTTPSPLTGSPSLNYHQCLGLSHMVTWYYQHLQLERGRVNRDSEP